MKFMTSFGVMAAFALTTACGGSSTGGSPFGETGPITLNNLNASGEEFFEFLTAADADEINPISQTELVATGSAQYTGLMIAEIVGSTEGIVGRANIDANFADGGSLTGSVTDLTLVNNIETEVVLEDEDSDLTYMPLSDDTELTELAGSLALSGGEVGSESGFGVFDIDVAGNVTVPASLIEDGDGGVEEFDVSGEFLGTITDSDNLLAEGELTATSSNFEFGLDGVIFAE